ncbi:MAG: hypothetical protein IPK17_22560 [Chloroflexi bacterium]|uniref:hypothetical protein n=1 Tax=Candidatus Flexifilum breve TaxID=3140694 RepID=UPI00313673DE|nr:hypothetical protein [Chloroflexota bacterium]
MQKYNDNRIMAVLVLVALITGYLSSRDEQGQVDLRGLGGNLATELIGAVATYYIMDRQDARG